MKNYCLIFFADEWGPTKGGINTFNYDLCISIGDISKEYDTKVICVCSNSLSQKEKEDAFQHNVMLVDLNKGDFDSCNFAILNKYTSDCTSIYSIGHDKITACQCKALRNFLNCKTVLFHHMDYEAYYGASALGVEVNAKIKEQKQAFLNIDYIIAVGPQLFSSLQDKVKDWNLQSIIGEVVPGLSDISPCADIFNRFRVLVSGRIEEKNDKIKQYGVTLEAYCKLQKNEGLADGSRLTLLGLDKSDLGSLEKNIRNQATNLADGFVNIIPLPYTADRQEYFNELKGSSVVTMPSISEGFGLIGLEAISAGIPLILSQNSGLYKLLHKLGLNGYVTPLNIKGHIDNSTNPTDVDNMYKALKHIKQNSKENKNRALELREKLLENNITWTSCSKAFLSLIEIKKADASKSLTNLLPSTLNKIPSMQTIATRCIDGFLSELNELLKIDCSSILTTKIDNIDDLYCSIIDIDSVSRRQLDKIDKLVESLLEVFFTSVIRVIKELEDQIAADILINELLCYNKESMRNRGLLWKQFIELDEMPSNKVPTMLREIVIRESLSSHEKDCLNMYHNLVSKSHEYLDFEGLSIMISTDTAIRIPLKNIFAEVGLHSNQVEKRPFYRSKTIYQNYTEQFVRDRRVLVLGDPGTGKSTLLQKVILDACESHNFRMCIPIKIANLSSWLSKTNHTKKLEEYILKEILNLSVDYKSSIRDVYIKLKKAGGLFIILDGYDEVNKYTERNQINNMITEYIKETSESIFVITSRKVGYDNYFESLNFKQYEIEPLRETAISHYVGRWYNIIGSTFKDTGIRYLERAQKLIRIIKKDESIRSLAQNPLLLSILVILHYHGINLPNNKIRLYETITNTLLETWIERRGFIQDRYDVDFLTMFFSDVAYKIVDDNYDTMLISEHSLKHLYSLYIEEKGFLLNDSTEKEEIESFVDYISESLGVLLKKGAGINNENLYGFLMHRQFTEYFAAIKLEELVSNNEIDLESIVFNPKWIEIFSLMGCYMNNQHMGGKKRVNRIIEKTLSISTKPMKELDYNLQLALKLLNNNVYIDNKTQKRIVVYVRALFREGNPYKIDQFCDELIPLSNSIYRELFLNQCLFASLQSDNYEEFRSACMVINSMYKNREEISDNSFLQDNQLLISSMQRLILNEEDIDVFFTNEGNYFRAYFENCFLKTINLMESNKNINTKNIEHLKSLTKFFACADIDERITDGYEVSTEIKHLETIKKEYESILNQEIATCYLSTIILLNYGYTIAAGNSINYELLLKYFPTFKPFVTSCLKIANEKSPLRGYAVRWINSDFRIWHLNDDKYNYYTILKKNNQELLRYDITLPYAFSIDDLKRVLAEQGITDSKMCLHCLFVTNNDKIPESCLKELFEYAFDNSYILYGSIWSNLLLNKAFNNDNLMYEYYTLFVAKNMFNRTSAMTNLTPLGHIIQKLFFRPSLRLTTKDNKWLIETFEKLNATNKEESHVIYDILNRANNPFRRLQERRVYDFDF